MSSAVSVNTSRATRAPTAPEKSLVVEAQQTNGKIRKAVVIELGEAKICSCANLIGHTRIDSKKHVIGPVRPGRVIGIRVAKAQSVFLIADPEVSARCITMQCIVVGVMVAIVA